MKSLFSYHSFYHTGYFLLGLLLITSPLSAQNLYVDGGTTTVITTTTNVNGVYVSYNSSDSNDLLEVEAGGTLNEYNQYSEVVVGIYGSGSLTLSGGNIISAGGSTLADLGGSAASVSITGGVWSNTSGLTVGEHGDGTLTMSGGTFSDNSTEYIAFASDSTSTLTISGGLWTNNGFLITGYSGVGSLTISGGNVDDTVGEISKGGGTGVVTLSGTGVWSNSGLPAFNGNQSGDAGLYVGASSGSGTLNFGSFGGNDSGGTLISPSIALGLSPGAYGDNGPEPVGGTINFNQSNTVTLSSAIYGYGSINQLGRGTTILTGVSDFNGNTVIGSGTLALGPGGSLDAIITSSTAAVPTNGVIINQGGTLAIGGSLNPLGGAIQYDATVNGGYYEHHYYDIPDTAVALNGGTISMATNGAASRTSLLQIGSLIVNSNSVIDFSNLSGKSIVNIQNLSFASPADTLSIYNWNGGYGGYGMGGALSMTGGSNSFTALESYDNIVMKTGIPEGSEVVPVYEHYTDPGPIFAFGGTNGPNNIKFYSGAGSGYLGSGYLFMIPTSDGFTALTGAQQQSILDGTTDTNSGATIQSDPGNIAQIYEILPIADSGTIDLTNGTLSNTGTMTITNSRWIIESNALVINLGNLLIGGSNGPGQVTVINNSWSNSGDVYVGASGSGDLDIQAGGSFYDRNGYLDDNPGSTGTATISGLWSNSGTLTVGQSGTGSLSISGAGTVVANAGVTVASDAASSGTLNFGTFGGTDSVASNALVTPSITFGSGTGTINFNQTNSYTLEIPVSGPGTLHQLGSGTTILSGSNNYTGGTLVSAGTLLVGNTTGSGTGSGLLTVNAGATLGGNGTVGGEAIINGNLPPSIGSSPVTLSFDTNLTLGATSATTLQIASTNSYDQIRVGGILTYGGTLDFSLGSSTNAPKGTAFNLFTDLQDNPVTTPNLLGDFTSVTASTLAGYWNFTETSPGIWNYLAGTDDWQFSYSNGQLLVKAIPEPSTDELLGLGAFLLIVASLRRASLLKS